MSDIERLKEAFDRGTLIRPGTGRTNLVDLFTGLARWAGAPKLPATDGSRTLVDLIRPEQRVVFVIVDGLGSTMLEEGPPRSFLRKHRVAELHSIFPASTAPVMTSLATASWPATHAVATWWVHMEQRKLQVVSLPFTERSSNTPLGQLGVRPDELFPHPSVWPTVRHEFTAILPENLAGSSYSHYAFGERSQRSYHSLPSARDAVTRAIGASRRTSMVYLYLPQFDELVHHRGCTAAATRELLVEIDRLIEGIALDLKESARLVVTADHGMIDIPRDGWITPDLKDPLLSLLRVLPTGEPRVPVFHVKPGKEADFAREFRNRCSEHFLLLTPDELEAMRLLGPEPLSSELRSRLGSFVATPLAQAGFLARWGETGAIPLFGMHGGMTPAEMRVPLIVV